jgi:hypothetical protein
MDIEPEQQWGTVEITETLVGRKAGTGASEKARELRHAQPLEAVVSRLTGKHSDERAWSKGAIGEKVAGLWLSRLPDGWHVFHDVEVGEHDANIDHVVIGPGGVFAINAKNLRGKVVVTPRSLTLNGHRTDFLPVATHEARRASRLLSAALGREILVRPIIALIVDDLVIKQPPTDVTVVKVGGLRRWLLGQPPTITPAEVVSIAGLAHKPSTWVKSSAEEGASCHCGGTLVRRARRSDGRQFLGCSRFPTCRRSFDLPS